MSKVSLLEQEIKFLRNQLALLSLDRDEIHQKHTEHMKHCILGDSLATSGHKGCLTSKKDLYIAHLEEQLKHAQSTYQEQMSLVKPNVIQMETTLQDMRKDVDSLSVKAEQFDNLNLNLLILQKKLKRRKKIISHYRQQHDALIGLITNLGFESLLTNIVTDPQIGADETETNTSLEDMTDLMQVEKSVMDFHNLNAALRKKALSSEIDL